MAPRNDMTVTIGAEGNLIDVLSRAQTQVKRFDDQVKKSGSVVQAYGSQHSEMTKKFKFFRGAAQQLGYQIGDYAVQVANGTSKMQAFGQQGSQMLGVFGPIGALLGAGVAIFSAIAVAAEKASGGVSKLSDAMKSLSSSAADFETKMSMIRFGVDTEAEAVALQQLADTYATIREKYKQMSETDSLRSRLRISEEIKLERQKIPEIQKTLDKLRESRSAYESALAINKAMLATDLARAKMTGDIKRALDREMAARKQYGASRLAAARVIALQERADLIKTHGEQNKLMGESQKKSLDMLNRRQKAWYQYYQSRVAGERMVALATENYNKQVGRGRGGDPRQFAPNLFEFRQQLLDAENQAKKAAGGAGVDAMESLMQELSLRKDLIGKTEAQKEVLNALGSDWRKYGMDAVNSIAGQIESLTALEEAIQSARERTQSIADTLKSSMTDAFMSIVDGTKSAKEAFKAMARSIIAKLYEVLVVQRLVGQFNAATGKGSGIVGAIMGAFGKRATGGPITAGKPYMVGEKGPELVVPSRNGNVVPNNQLSGGGVTVIQNNTFGQGVSRAEINAMLPKIVETTKAAVFDAQRRSVTGRGYA